MRLFLIGLLSFLASLAIAATPSTSWKIPSDTVCGQINAALRLYQKNDIKNARLAALMSYFKGYDAEIEPAVRITLGGPHVFAVEKEFRQFYTLMTPNPDKNQIKKVADFAGKLCQLVNDDAKALNADNVPRQVFKVE